MRTVELTTIKAMFISAKDYTVRRLIVFFWVLIKSIDFSTISGKLTDNDTISFKKRYHIGNRLITKLPMLPNAHSTFLEWYLRLSGDAGEIRLDKANFCCQNRMDSGKVLCFDLLWNKIFLLAGIQCAEICVPSDRCRIIFKEEGIGKVQNISNPL